MRGRGEGKKERERKEGKGRERKGREKEEKRKMLAYKPIRGQRLPDSEMWLGTGRWPNQGSTNGVYIHIAMEGPGQEMWLGTDNHNKAGDGHMGESRDSHLIQI